MPRTTADSSATPSENLSIAGGGRGAVLRFAPAAAVALDDLEAIAWRRVDPDLLDLAARVISQLHRIPALARPSACGPSPWQSRDAGAWRSFAELDGAQRAALAFAEQFSLDVSNVDDEQRANLVAGLGSRAAEFAQAVYVVDVIARARFVLDRLFGPSASVDSSASVDPSALVDPHLSARPHRIGERAGGGLALKQLGPDATIWNGIEEVIRVIPGLQGLDAVTTELVRLRGARQHNCRVCQSVRSRSAMVAGANDETFGAVDHYATSELPDATKAALALTDAFIWTPGRIGEDEIGPLARHFTPAQQVELVLDIARNASNKFAVSMAADGTDVKEGYQVYEVHPDGSIEYGLSAP